MMLIKKQLLIALFLTVSRHHQDTVSLNSYSNNKVCSGLPIKNAADIYDNGQETCDNCDQTAYYPSIYATDPTAIDRLVAQQTMPNFVTANHLAANLSGGLNAGLTNGKAENNYHEGAGSLPANVCNSLGAILNASNVITNSINNTISNTINNTLSNTINNAINSSINNAISNQMPSSNCLHGDEYDFVDPHANNQFCTNKACAISGHLSTDQLNQLNSATMNSKLMNAISSTGMMSSMQDNRSSHVYDIPHRQQQALNKLKQQMSTFKSVEQF